MKKNHFLFTLVVLLLISCNKTKDSSDNNSAITDYNDNNSSAPVETYVFNNELVWADEFDEDGSISLDRWTPETIPPVDGCCWYNGEFQFYTDKSDNVIGFFFSDNSPYWNANRYVFAIFTGFP